MQFYSTGSASINDEDEEYLADGKAVYVVDPEVLMSLLNDAVANVPMFFTTRLYSEITKILSGEGETGFCCGTEFRANIKTAVCPKCGKIVRLT